MLEFASRDFIDFSHNVGLMLGMLNRASKHPDEIGRSISQAMGGLLEQCNRLNLPVTAAFLSDFVVEAFGNLQGEEKDQAVAHLRATGELRVTTDLNAERTVQHIESVHRSFRAELSSLMLRVIPREQSKYCDAKWLEDSPVLSKYPETIDEFHKAGRCFAYGENTACVFHLMRVTDFYLRKVADSLGIVYDCNNWKGIGDKISANMQQRYQLKTDEWKKDEPFYAGILTDIQAIGRGHRNQAIHELEKKYDEREAAYMLTVIEAFARHVAEKL
jgi:hypothetical protein